MEKEKAVLSSFKTQLKLHVLFFGLGSLILIIVLNASVGESDLMVKIRCTKLFCP